MSRTRFIVAGNFIDGNSSKVRRNIFLAVKDTIITVIGSTDDLPHHDSAAIDDFSHCTILPALVDCSVSLSQSPSVNRMVRLSAEEVSLAKKAALLEQHIRYCHTYGVQGIATNDDITDLMEHYQKEMTHGGIINIRTPCPVIPESEDCVEGDFLKIGYSGNIEDEETPLPHLNNEDVLRISQHKGGRKAVVVANGQQQVTEALEAGCEAIEQGYGMGEDNLKIMAKKDVLWIPSVLRAKNGLDSAGTGGDVCCRFSQRYVAPGKPNPRAEVFWKKMLAEQLKQLSLARELGVKTAVGTGAGSIGILHGESMVEEMKLFIKAGYSLEETIQCASKNGAEFFGMEKLGTLTVGRKATFLITRGTAQQLPRKLSYLEGIYVDGAPSIAYTKNPIRTT